MHHRCSVQPDATTTISRSAGRPREGPQGSMAGSMTPKADRARSQERLLSLTCEEQIVSHRP